MKFSPLVLVWMVLGLVACKADGSTSPANDISQASDAKPVSTLEVSPKVQGVWIDVREVGEYTQGHLEGAINIPNRDLARRIATIVPQKDTPIHVYCRSGNRSETARQILMGLGYTNVVNQGGYRNLKEQGYR